MRNVGLSSWALPRRVSIVVLIMEVGCSADEVNKNVLSSGAGRQCFWVKACATWVNDLVEFNCFPEWRTFALLVVPSVRHLEE